MPGRNLWKAINCQAEARGKRPKPVESGKLPGRSPWKEGCPSLVMWNSSSEVERLRIPRGRKLESAIVLMFVVPVILTSLALLKPNVSCLGAYRCMLSVMGLCRGEGPICAEVSLYLDGDACVEVEWFVRLKYEEMVREEFLGRCEPVYCSSPVTDMSL
ncbi:hypothetical protein CRG98_014735 [Punica granatum]|uniref:Uncharacterized protein n=1 Tax=Punica granatum TaxID=22663 RepID=A0A2I0K8I5_PUNGR|nr:hypothetical protein CRG98_014735 [Punica granatum]